MGLMEGRTLGTVTVYMCSLNAKDKTINWFGDRRLTRRDGEHGRRPFLEWADFQNGQEAMPYLVKWSEIIFAVLGPTCAIEQDGGEMIDDEEWMCLHPDFDVRTSGIGSPGKGKWIGEDRFVACGMCEIEDVGSC